MTPLLPKQMRYQAAPLPGPHVSRGFGGNLPPLKTGTNGKQR